MRDNVAAAVASCASLVYSPSRVGIKMHVDQHPLAHSGGHDNVDTETH